MDEPNSPHAKPSELPGVHRWSMRPLTIPTRWAKDVDPTNVWPDYPRPQMVRPDWRSLNGLWEYVITPLNSPMPAGFTGKILVPFPLESALSGVAISLGPDELLWYRVTFEIGPEQGAQRTLLHFGAVDFEASVFVNGHAAGSHKGGYQAFSLDIGDHLQPGENELIVRVWDPTDRGGGAYGKQRLRPEWAFYTPSSGIWQSVWLEHVPTTYISKLRLTPLVDQGQIHVEALIEGARSAVQLEAVARTNGSVVARASFEGAGTLQLEAPRLWSPADPFLYDLELRLVLGGKTIDRVESYFGMRKVEVRKDHEGFSRIHLNDEPIFNMGIVDQGFWPDGLHTAPCDEAFRFDLEMIKALGFNTVRKHIKVEPSRWYAHCDRLGLLVWQDMPSGNNECPMERAQFEHEIRENIDLLHNHPSIIAWVPFNEGWGNFEQGRVTDWLKSADPSRVVNGHSGPYDQLKLAQMFKRISPLRLPSPFSTNEDVTDEYQATQDEARWNAGHIADLHYYPGPRMFRDVQEFASVTGEHGSFGVHIAGHVLDETLEVGKGIGGSRLSPAEFLQRYSASVEQLASLQAEGLSGAQYFQLSDVETEQQGFLTYDRECLKLPVAQIARLNSRLSGPASAHRMEMETKLADQRSEPELYRELVDRYKSGDRNPRLLLRLSLTALRQGDQRQASEAADAYVSHSPHPTEAAEWRAILAITARSADRGFALLCGHAREADDALGQGKVRNKLIDIIEREEVRPLAANAAMGVDWTALENAVCDRHGAIGRAAVARARMMYHLVRSEWPEFGAAFVRFYDDEGPLRHYPHHAICYQLVQNVQERAALAVGVRTMLRIVETCHEFKFGCADPAELDTYASLLYKLGRVTEALEWQERAVSISDGRDTEIVGHLADMQAGRPTWLR